MTISREFRELNFEGGFFERVLKTGTEVAMNNAPEATDGAIKGNRTTGELSERALGKVEGKLEEFKTRFPDEEFPISTTPKASQNAPAPKPKNDLLKAEKLKEADMHPKQKLLDDLAKGGLTREESAVLLNDGKFKEYMAGLKPPQQRKVLKQILDADATGTLEGKLKQASDWYVPKSDSWVYGSGWKVNADLKKSGLTEAEGKLLVRTYMELKGKITP